MKNNKLNKIKKSTQSGFSIVELMISVFIGLIILTGLISVFDTTSRMNRAQNGLARIQENGRFVILQMKQNIEQAGYQYCMSSGEEEREGKDEGTIQRPWNVYTAAPVFPGVPLNPYFDTKDLIHGHECTGSTCTPDFTTDGTDTSYTIPSIGTADGNRIKDTDVLTIRYIASSGRAVDSIIDGAAGQKIINISPFATTPTTSSTRILVASCNASPVYAADVVSSGGGALTVTVPAGEPMNGGSGDLTRIFDLDRDVRTITYYVANNIVDGRSIPTLYSVVNGTVNALIEGVDRFDVLYGVGKGVGVNAVRSYYTADQVQDLDALECRPLPDYAPAGMVNDVGCGWRGVEMIEIHLLLNTVANSTLNPAEEFKYSLDGNSFQTPSNLTSGLDHYKLQRREFFALIDLKNSSK